MDVLKAEFLEIIDADGCQMAFVYPFITMTGLLEVDTLN